MCTRSYESVSADMSVLSIFADTARCADEAERVKVVRGAMWDATFSGEATGGKMDTV